MHRWCLLLAAVGVCITTPGCRRTPPPAKTGQASVDTILGRHGPGVEVSLWVGGADGVPRFEWNSAVPRPTASSIKAFFLVELFAAHAKVLDGPLPGSDAVLDDDRHPAMSVFDPDERGEIRRVLRGATVRRIGEAMVKGVNDANPKHAIAVYNAAANLAMAALGGPEALTRLIRAREVEFADVCVRRYMLADRESGDNEAPATAFAALYGKLTTRKLENLGVKTGLEIQTVLLRNLDDKKGVQFGKPGSLTSDPQVFVRAGCWEGKERTMVFVVMLTQIDRGREGQLVALERLEKTAEALEKALHDLDAAPTK